MLVQVVSDVYRKTNNCVMTLIVCQNICGTLLIVCVDVELNSGPSI